MFDISHCVPIWCLSIGRAVRLLFQFVNCVAEFRSNLIRLSGSWNIGYWPALCLVRDVEAAKIKCDEDIAARNVIASQWDPEQRDTVRLRETVSDFPHCRLDLDLLILSWVAGCSIYSRLDE
jgi:hypothetical protein